MRILIVNHFPLNGSGSGTYTENVAVHLAKQGHEVCVILPENTKDIKVNSVVRLHPIFFTYKEQIAGALPFNFPCFTSHPRSTVTFEDLTEGQLQQYLESFESAILEEVNTFKPDIIHAQHIWMLAALGARTGVPTVITAHGTDLMGYKKWPQFRSFADEAVKRCKGIVTISKDTNSQVLELFAQSKNKTHIIKNGYDTSVFYPEKANRQEVLAKYNIHTKADHFVMFAGKMTEFKGIDILLKAAKIYENNGLGNVVTCIAGSGELEDSLKKQAKDLHLQNVHFLGHTPHDKLRALYSVADVSTVPSRREPFGLVAIEALACGTPVVATNQGGLVDFITPQVGALVEVDNPKSLSEAIVKECTLTGDERQKRRDFAAKYAFDNYSQEQNTKELIAFYNSVLQQN